MLFRSVGYSTQMVRFIAFCASGFFAGVAGGLAAIHYEIVTASVVGAGPSGYVLLMAYIGGVAFFIGPIIGAVLMTALQISLSDYTGAWLLYVGLMFVLVVMYAPWGLAGLLLMHQPLLATGTWRRVLPAYGLALAPVLMLCLGGVLLIETSHHLLVKSADGSAMRLLGMAYDAKSATVWLGMLVLLGLGGWALKRVAPQVSEAFHAARQAALAKQVAP